MRIVESVMMPINKKTSPKDESTFIIVVATVLTTNKVTIIAMICLIEIFME